MENRHRVMNYISGEQVIESANQLNTELGQYSQRGDKVFRCIAITETKSDIYYIFAERKESYDWYEVKV